MFRIWMGMAMLAGCDQVFDLDRAEAPCVGAVEHDEDGDRIDDTCDVCPGIANTGQEDLDDDGVGDRCDPRPDQATEARVWFFSFAEADAPSRWMAQSMWSFEQDRLVFTGVSAQVSSQIKLSVPPTPPPYLIQVGVTLDQVDRTVSSQFAVVGNGFKDEAYLECSLAHDTTDALYAFRDDQMGDQQTDYETLEPGAFAAGKSFVVRMSVGTRITCRVDSSGDLSANVSVVGPVGGHIALQGMHVNAHVDWMAIYSTAP